jgi:hypothetical protein
MRRKYGYDLDCKLVPLTNKNLCLTKRFSCGNEAIDYYLKNVKLDDYRTKTYLFTNLIHSRLFGYATICCSALSTSPNILQRISFPAIEIKYFALDKCVQHLSYDSNDCCFRLSDYLFGETLRKCKRIRKESIGAQFVILYSVPEAQNFYRRHLFREFEAYMERDDYKFIEGCIPMFLDI